MKTSKHYIQPLLLAGVLTLWTGCFEHSGDPELGAELSAETLLTEIEKPFYDVDILDKSVGESLSYVTTQRFQGMADYFIVSEQGFEITSKDDSDPEYVLFKIENVNVSYSEGQGKLTVKEMSLTVQRATAAASLAENATVLSKAKEQLNEYLFKASQVQTQEEDEGRTSLHNLRVEQYLVEAPDKVKDRPNCNGLKDCYLETTRVRFDLAFRDGGDRVENVYNYDLFISPQVPFFAGPIFTNIGYSGVVQFCVQTWIPNGENNVLIRECQTLDDYSWD